jgi:hypothetical protein
MYQWGTQWTKGHKNTFLNGLNKEMLEKNTKQYTYFR